MLSCGHVCRNNVKEIRRLCAEGLHGELREKLASKPKSEILRLGMRVRRKRVLSDRTMIIPAEYADGDQKARLRQAVVRLTVQQGLKRFGERSLAERIQFETERQRLFGSAGVVGTGAAALAAAASARAGAAPADIRIASPEQAAAEKSWVAQRGGQAYHVVHTVPDHVSVQYVVIQQRILFGQQQDWKLWGFVQPTSIESLEKANVLARSTGATSFREKLSELVGTRTG